jgi:hypothetical protein
MTIIARNPSACSRLVDGLWDFYYDASGAESAGGDCTPPETPWTPYIPRTASIYLTYPVCDWDSYDDWFVIIDDSGDGRNFQSKTIGASICPLGIADSETVDLYCVDNGNHHVEKLWQWTDDAEDFSEVGDSANIAFGWTSAAVRFYTNTTTKNYTQSERGRWSGTWEDLGMPSGSIITEVEFVSLKRKVQAVTDKLTSHTIAVKMADSSGGAILDADLLSATALPTSTDSSFVPINGDGTHRSVDSGSQAYDSSIRIELQYALTLNNNAGNPAEETRFDDLRLVIYFHDDSETPDLQGTLQVDAEAKEVNWIVTDADWHAHEPDAWPEMGSVVINVFGEPWLSPITSNVPDHDRATAGACAYAGGLRRWYVAVGGGSPYHLSYGANLWEIDADGVFTYRGGTDSYTQWLADGGTDANYPEFLDNIGSVDALYDEDGNLLPTLDLYYPICQAPQSNKALGTKKPYLSGFPPTLPEFPDSYQYQPDVEINIGTFQLGDTPLDDNMFPFVDGGVFWSKTNSATFDFYVGTGFTFYWVGVAGFDAGPDVAIGIIDWYYDDGGGSTPGAPPIHGRQSLVIGDAGTSETIYVLFDNDGSTFDPDRSAYYPPWLLPRAWHPTEAAQGGGQRCSVFSRLPFDETEIADWGNSNALGGYTLRVFMADGSSDFSLATRWGRSGHASGQVDLSTSSASTLGLLAVSGGDADGDEGNNFDGLDIEQTDTDEPESTSYDTGTHRLTVKIDIAGGHNTVADLKEIINYGGDFTIAYSTNEHDEYEIEDADTGTPTDPFTGGDSTGNSATVSVNQPTVHTSSDRYFYLSNFPLREYDLVDNGIGGQVRRACWRNGLAGDFARNWRISHDGSIADPVGAGLARWNRTEMVAYFAPGNQGYDSIKNSKRLPLTPPYRET